MVQRHHGKGETHAKVHHMTLLTEIEAFCHRNGMAETTFGRRVVNDNSFVRDLRNGRDVKLSTVQRVQAWMAAHEGKSNG